MTLDSSASRLVTMAANSIDSGMNFKYRCVSTIDEWPCVLFHPIQGDTSQDWSDVFSDQAMTNRIYSGLTTITASGTPIDGSLSVGQKAFLLGFFSIILRKRSTVLAELIRRKRR